MSANNDTTNTLSITYATATMPPTAVTAPTMTNIPKPRASASRSAPSLSATAKTLTRYLFGEVQLPASLSHYAAFFAGFVTGAVGASALYGFLNRNKCDRAKVQLAVYHIVRFFQHHPTYEALLQHPRELLKHMEPEVMRMVGMHLTTNEAGAVIKELKRTYEVGTVEEHVHKRVRANKRDVVRERMQPHLTAAYSQSPRGFLPELDSDQPDVDHVPIRKSGLTSAIKAHLPFGARDFRSDSSVQEDDHVNRDMLTSDQKQLRFGLEQYDHDKIDVDGASSPLPQHFIETPCPSGRRSSAPSPESGPTSIGLAFTPTPAPKGDGYASGHEYDAPDKADDLGAPVAKAPKMSAKAKGKQTMKSSPHAPHLGSFGLDYTSRAIYSSDSSSSDEEDLSPPPPKPIGYTTPKWLQDTIAKAKDDPSKGRRIDTPQVNKRQSLPPRSPTVVRKLHGVKCSGASLSPIPEGISPVPTNGQAVEDAQVESANELPFAHWSTAPVMTYSSDEDETPNETPALDVATTPAPSSSSTPTIPSEFLQPAEDAEFPEPTGEAGGFQQTINISSVTAINITPPKEVETITCSPEPDQEQLPPCPPSKKRSSPSSDRTQDDSPPPKRARSSPLADITASVSNGMGSSSPKRKSTTPSPVRARKSASPRAPLASASASPVQQDQPLKRGRGRRRSIQPKAPETPQAPKAKREKSAKTPGTRKTARSTAYNGAYPK